MGKTIMKKNIPGGSPGNPENSSSAEAGFIDFGGHPLPVSSDSIIPATSSFPSRANSDNNTNLNVNIDGKTVNRQTGNPINIVALNQVVIKGRSSSLSEILTAEGKQNWNIVNEKRVRNSPKKTTRLLKQTKMKEYWLSASVPTSTRSEALDNETEETVVLQVRPPSIFVDGVNNIQSLTELVSNTFANNYEIKILRAEQVRIFYLGLQKPTQQ